MRFFILRVFLYFIDNKWENYVQLIAKNIIKNNNLQQKSIYRDYCNELSSKNTKINNAPSNITWKFKWTPDDFETWGSAVINWNVSVFRLHSVKTGLMESFRMSVIKLATGKEQWSLNKSWMQAEYRWNILKRKTTHK